jgi:hypothetical protein
MKLQTSVHQPPLGDSHKTLVAQPSRAVTAASTGEGACATAGGKLCRHLAYGIPGVDFAVIRELFFKYTGKEGDPTYMQSSDGSSRSREVAEA